MCLSTVSKLWLKRGVGRDSVVKNSRNNYTILLPKRNNKIQNKVINDHYNLDKNT